MDPNTDTQLARAALEATLGVSLAYWVQFIDGLLREAIVLASLVYLLLRIGNAWGDRRMRRLEEQRLRNEIDRDEKEFESRAHPKIHQGASE